MYTYIYIYIYIYTYIYIYVYIYIHICIYRFTYIIHAYTHVYWHVYLYTHTYIYTHTHTHTCVYIINTQAVCERTWREPSRHFATPRMNWRAFCLERTSMDERWQHGLVNSRVTVLKSDQAPVFNVTMHGHLIYVYIILMYMYVCICDDKSYHYSYFRETFLWRFSNTSRHQCAILRCTVILCMYICYK